MYCIVLAGTRGLRPGFPEPASPRTTPLLHSQTISRKKRKLQHQLHEAENSVSCPLSRIESLRQKIALAHIGIRDAINEELLYRETQAAEKLKSNPKYFYSYAKKFSRKKSSINLLFDKDGNVKSNPKDIANILQNQFSSVLLNFFIILMMSWRHLPKILILILSTWITLRLLTR